MKVTQAMINAFMVALGDSDEHPRRVGVGIQAVLDLIEQEQRPEQHNNPNLINVRGVSEESAIITVDRAEYEQAKADGTLDHLLDVYLSDMDGETYVIEPDGTVVYPYA